MFFKPSILSSLKSNLCNRNKMAAVGRQACRVFLSRLAFIQTQAKNLYKCKRDGAISQLERVRGADIDASVLSSRYNTDSILS